MPVVFARIHTRGSSRRVPGHLPISIHGSEIDMAKKSYLDLKKEVWDTGRCSGCGACVAVCPADALSFTEGEIVISPGTSGYCKQATDTVPCGACYEACPRIGDQP